ncbi:olfactory receptor 6B9-like [Dendropsophus ebraccatus]|uniref:olfactory receptor 6B9-like n=1 Tax=Dendropsophus ebraccatus TaxID=150705 RepID=UPI003831BAF2
MKNQTRVTEFVLLGFGDFDSFNILFFLFFLIIFLLTLMGNLMMILLVSVTPQLQTPMYYFLCHLSLSDLVISGNIVPNMLAAILHGGIRMSYVGCITQLYVLSGTAFTECFLLPVMSYDRYLAICNPLRYSSIMDIKFRTCLSLWSWLLGFTLNLVGVLPVSELNFCHDNIIDHFFCDISPLMKLSCSDTSLVELDEFLFCSVIFFLPWVFTIVTYVYILLTIVKIPTTTGKKKAFSTCSSHLIVVATFYGTLIVKFMVPSKASTLFFDKIISLLHAVFTPLFNPIIYSLRNQDIKMALKKVSGK